MIKVGDFVDVLWVDDVQRDFLNAGYVYKVLEISRTDPSYLVYNGDGVTVWVKDNQVAELVDMVNEDNEDAKTGSDKRRFSLVPTEALQAVIDVMESGNLDLPWRKAYPIDSWKRKSGSYRRRYLDALQRHVFASQRGEVFTVDTGCYNWAAVAVNALFLLQFDIEEEDNPVPSHDGHLEIENMKAGIKAYNKGDDENAVHA